MAEKARYPQIPGTVWWGVRSILNKTPRATVDDRLLGIELDVQPTAAKQYISELVAVGILTEESKATPLAEKWRLDSTYEEAVSELMAKAYPQGLRDVAPYDRGDRLKAISWFKQGGLGEGTAKNKAATYFLLGTADPNEAPSRNASARTASTGGTIKSAKRTAESVKPSKADEARSAAVKRSARTLGADIMPLNVNLQIHISADAGSDQIEAIFSAMRRYLHDQQGS